MKRRGGLALALVPLALVLAACSPTEHIALPSHPHATKISHPVASISPSPTPTPTLTPVQKAPAVPPTINPPDYLINGTPNVPDSNGEWYGEWAFFTDSSKRVWCQISVYNDDGPGASCSIVPSATNQVTYAIPASVRNKCGDTDGIDTDGYGLGLGLALQADPNNPEAGWAGCSTDFYLPPADLAKSKVLPDGGTLAVDPFTCTVKSSVATCVFNDTYTSKTGTITLGLGVATFSQT